MEAPPESINPTPERGMDFAWFHLRCHLRLWLPAIVLAGLDLWSKQWAFSSLGPNETRTMIPHVLEFRRSLNDGAVFGSFTGFVGVFVVASVVALGFVVYVFGRSGRQQWGLHLALGMVMAGAIGNLYDRALIKADVVTFQTRAGKQRSFIGACVSEPSAPILRCGDWPDGAHPRRFASSEVSLRRQGVVRDFIKFAPKVPKWVPKIGGIDMWPWIFNVADASLVVGVGMLLLQSSRGHRKREAPALPGL